VVPGDHDVLLFIDQFEEVLTLVENEQERAHFLGNLLEAAANARSRLRILVTLRADFYDRPLLYPAFGELLRQSTEVVLPLNPDELEQAISRPAQRVGLTLEPGLVAAMIGDIGEQPGALPLLQYALSELYERREGRRLTTEAYEASGRVIGALARRADELYDEADEEVQDLIRQLLLRLVTLGEGTEDTRRRVQQIEVLTGEDAHDSQVLAIIERYGQYRLLTFDRDPATRTPTVEVAHEALIRQWPRLREWIENSREDLQIQRRLTQAAQEWANAEQDASFLASGARLEQFESWADETELMLNQQERDYLEFSLARRQQLQAEEDLRQAHEALLERRSRQRLQLLVAVMALAAVVALLLSGFAFSQRDVAERSAVTATVAQGQAQIEADNAATAAAVAALSAAEARSLALVSSAETRRSLAAAA
jgi:predicted nucleic acid-binding protein